MSNKRWLVGRNRHTGEWAEGGRLADYPREHWERFIVEAGNRDQARLLAQDLRGKQRRMTEKQQVLLKDLLDETRNAEADGMDPDELLIELSEGEARSASRLAALGLIDCPAADTPREARVTPMAWNFHDFTATTA